MDVCEKGDTWETRITTHGELSPARQQAGVIVDIYRNTCEQIELHFFIFLILLPFWSRSHFAKLIRCSQVTHLSFGPSLPVTDLSRLRSSAQLPARERRPRWRTAFKSTPIRSSSFDVRPTCPDPDRATSFGLETRTCYVPPRKMTPSFGSRLPGPGGVRVRVSALKNQLSAHTEDITNDPNPHHPPFLPLTMSPPHHVIRSSKNQKNTKKLVELKKQIPTTIRLYNPGSAELAFKVKTTAPKKYCVKPNTGFVAPGATQIVHVIMQAQRDWPADVAGCKDKFLVQSVPSGGATDFTELFSKGKEGITETKLKVVYAQPQPPPRPVPEGEEDTRTEDMGATSFKTSNAPLPSDVPSLQRELEQYRLKNESLSADLNQSLRTRGGGQRGFSLLHLLITGTHVFFVFYGRESSTTSSCFLLIRPSLFPTQTQ